MPASVETVFGIKDLRAVRIKTNKEQMMYRTRRMWPSARVPPYRVSAGWLWVLHSRGIDSEWHLYTVY